METQKQKEVGISTDEMIREIYELSKEIPEVRKQGSIRLSDMIMSGFAVFSLKFPSLLSFDKEMSKNPNLRNMFHIEEVPSDTRMREVLDEIDPKYLRKMYTHIFTMMQKKKYLQDYQYYDGYYILSGDGTGYFSSKNIHCDNCMQKKNKKTGEIEYYHQFYGAAGVHPEKETVIPLCPESIMKQDGDNKNDCERNASKRFLVDLRREHPKLKIIIVEDSLSSNYPHIQELEKYDMKYVLGAKQGDHKFLFQYFDEQDKLGNVSHYEYTTTKHYPKKGKVETLHSFQFIKNAPLNECHPESRVNFIKYQ